MSFSSYKKSKLIFENFRKFVNEEADASKVDPKIFPTKLSDVDPSVAKVFTKSGADEIDKGNGDDVIDVSAKPEGVAAV